MCLNLYDNDYCVTLISLILFISISACILTVNVCLGFCRAWQGVVFDLLSVGAAFCTVLTFRGEKETEVPLSRRMSG